MLRHILLALRENEDEENEQNEEYCDILDAFHHDNQLIAQTWNKSDQLENPKESESSKDR